VDIPLSEERQNVSLSSASASTSASQIVPTLALSFLRWFDATVLKEIYLSQQPKKSYVKAPQVDGFEDTLLFAVDSTPTVSITYPKPSDTFTSLDEQLEPAQGFWGSAYNKLAELIRGKREKQLPDLWV